jgi:carotenoid cleavage dioxygenase-like enzyme
MPYFHAAGNLTVNNYFLLFSSFFAQLHSFLAVPPLPNTHTNNAYSKQYIMHLLADLLKGLKDLAENIEPKPDPVTEVTGGLMYTTRNETDGTLEVYEGRLPADLNGVFYTIYPVGSINSGGLPFPKTVGGKYNPEYGTPIMNGDGYIVSISFDGTQDPRIRTRVIKPPCYFADYATRREAGPSISAFGNMGLSRMSLTLGTRNLLNTAVIPVKFGETPPFLLSTYDVGRPFIMDPYQLKLQSPLGSTSDWVPATPDFLRWPFPIVQTTAHPSFDPQTEELFSINYYRASSSNDYLVAQKTAEYMGSDKELFANKLSAFCEGLADELDDATVAGKLKEFFNDLDHYVKGAEKKAEPSAVIPETSVWLMRWKGTEVIEKWMLIDNSGSSPVCITECMHQTALTEDYIVLTQCAFKFTLDLLINNPFPNYPAIDMILRKLLSAAMLPYTDCYIVKRSDLTAGGGQVIAHKLVLPGAQYPIPVETIHYSCDYANPEGKITLYGIHNSSACVAEWIRSYDKAKISGGQVDSGLVGMFALGSMDINRIGKWVIDTNTMTVDAASSKQYHSPGNIPADQLDKINPHTTDIGPNTWTLGLYTFRDIISPVKTVDKIKFIWYIANGADPGYLTEFVYDLYKDAADRILSVEDLLLYTAKGIPQTLVQMDCESMQPISHFQFPYGTYIRSLHFIPRPERKEEDRDVMPELDGYIFCTVQVPQTADTYRSEYWVFDAAKIASGPECKLYFNGIQFCFTLHTAWMENAEPYSLDYNVDVKGDYDAEIAKIFKGDPLGQALMQGFFDQSVYPGWYQQKTKQ